ncbi:unnamed protein product, partial [Allacma fusca]
RLNFIDVYTMCSFSWESTYFEKQSRIKNQEMWMNASLVP